MRVNAVEIGYDSTGPGLANVKFFAVYHSFFDCHGVSVNIFAFDHFDPIGHIYMDN